MTKSESQAGASNVAPASQPMVVELSKYRAEHNGGILEEVVAYWQSLRNGVAVPRRTDIDPRAIKAQLEHAFILERVAPGLARFRVAGQTINRLLGMDARGMTVSAMINNDDRLPFSNLLEEVFQTPSRVTLDVASHGLRPISGRIGLMPLKSDLGDISRALGVLDLQGDPLGSTPHRLRIISSARTPLLGDCPPRGHARAARVPDAPDLRDGPTRPTLPYADETDEANAAEIRDRIARQRRALLRVVEGSA